MGQAAEARPQGEVIDLWDVPLTAVRDPEHLKRINGFIAFDRVQRDMEAQALVSASTAMDHPDYPNKTPN